MDKNIAALVLVLIGLLSYTPLTGQSSAEGLVEAFPWRNIGPANQGGRIVDIDAVHDDFAHVYIALASGGVWKSTNAGTTWEPIFDNYRTASIGDIALDQQNGTLWVGTGEANNRNSTSWGAGIYKSTDDGASFDHMGLESTHHISRVLVHPNNSDNVCVCATGHLWGRSGERGIFRTMDGGQTWTKLTNGLPADGMTGCTDLVQDPRNPQILYAAMYDRLRLPWHFTSGSENGGIFKSADGGRSWTKLTNGLPTGATGRIGLAIYNSDPNIVMALVEAPRTGDLSKPGSGVYRSEDAGENWTYLNTYNNRPFYYSQIRINPHNDQRVYLLTTSFQVSEDGGQTFKNGSADAEVHGDFHALWHDPTDPDRYYLGADKGFSLTHDHGKHFTLIDNLPIAQFYRIGFDYREPYYVYGGLQDNGMYGTASFARDARGILNDHNWKLHWGDGMYVAVNPFDWRDVYTSAENGTYYKYDPLTHRIRRVSPNASNTLNYEAAASGGLDDLQSHFRFNWEGPLIMSDHDPKTLYVAGNFVYKSANGGEKWRIISPDLSTNDAVKRKRGQSGGVTPDNTGAETHCAITTLSESTIDPDILWAGTDDGQVHVTRNGGTDWEACRAAIPDVPEDLWVSRIEASHFQPGRAYISFDGHRSDHFQPWIFRTENYGHTWTKIIGGISSDEVVRVIREDLVNPDLLFAGTETGIWFSVNGGEAWSRFMQDFPTVSVYDLKIHPRDHDLIAGTHGRSIWIADDISPLQQMRPETRRKSVHLFEQKVATIWENVSRGGQRGHFLYMGENPPTIRNTSSKPRANFTSLACITYYCASGGADSLELTIYPEIGENTYSVKVPRKQGINRHYWNREFQAEKYSPEQEKYIDDIFADITNRYSSSALKRLYSAFKNAKSGREQRRAVAPLKGGYLSLPIPDSYLMPIAGPGTYRIVLRGTGVEDESGYLTVREDPLLSE